MKKIKIIFVPNKIFLLGLIILSCSSNVQDGKYVATVNGVDVPIKMFKQQMAKYKAIVYSEFSQKYSITNQISFWNATFGNDGIPAEALKRKSFDECIRIITQQMLAKKKGLLEDISYERFLCNLNSANEYRKQAVNDKKVIYGPIEYGEAIYFDHLLSLIVIDLKEKLANENFNTSDRKLKEFYESKKGELYRKKDSESRTDYYSFDDIKATVRSNYIDAEYELLINNLITTSEVKINNAVYDKISID